MSGMPKFHLRGHFFLTGESGCDKIPSNFILSQTVDAEITAMMPLQRACGAESQVRNKLSNGPLRAQPTEAGSPLPSMLRRVGIRQLPGICWYPAKGTGSFP